MLDHRCHRQSLKFKTFDPLYTCRIFLSFLFLQCYYHSSSIVRAQANITVDDGDSRIIYSPPGAWTKSTENQLDYGGSHMLTQNPNATARFNFSGTAIYLLSPLWPYKVNTAISLDSSAPSLVDLEDYSRPDTSQGSETVSSSVVWSATRLDNTLHIVQISVGAGQPYGILDALMYTDPSATSASTSTPSGRVVANPSYPTSSQTSHSKSSVSLALGVLFGILGIIIIFVITWLLWRRNKRRPVSEPWTVNGSGYDNTNSGVIPGYGNGQGHGPGYGPPSAYSYGQPLPYPPYTYGNYGTPGPFPVQAPAYPGVPPNRAPNRYQPGFTLSTITEKSTPQLPDGTRTMPGTPMSGAAGGTPLGAHSPGSILSELGYHTAPGSSVGQHSPPVIPGQVGPQSESQPQLQVQQQQILRPMGITSQMQMQGPDSSDRKR